MTLPVSTGEWTIPEGLGVFPSLQPSRPSSRSASTSSRQSLMLMRADEEWMRSRYGGTRCVFSQIADHSVEWCHILEVKDDSLQTTLGRLNLLPTDFRREGYQNMFPSQYSRPFDDGNLGFLPNRDVLEYFIVIEEGCLRFREDSIRKTNIDPGRIPYSQFYGKFDASSVPYDAYFDADIPSYEYFFRHIDRKTCYTDFRVTGRDLFPQIMLYLSLTIAIWVQTGRLDFSFNSATADPFVNLPLAIYLKALWAASPSQSRSLNMMRPTSLPHPGLWPYEAIPPGFTLFSTRSSRHDILGLSPSQSSVPARSLPEFDYQEKPEAKLKRLKFAGMTTEEAMFHELTSRGIAVMAEH
ncbi:hypothetical protein BT69DRAFT_1281377 [Atractiella rhizophila]|nr:hypothetical protein BT69DRAFT_1281377 [Atractiella rhizophila]